MKNSTHDTYMQMLATNMILALEHCKHPSVVEITKVGLHIQSTTHAVNHWALVVNEDLELLGIEIYAEHTATVLHKVAFNRSHPIYGQTLPIFSILSMAEFLVGLVRNEYLLPFISSVNLGIGPDVDKSITYNKPMWFIKALDALSVLGLDSEATNAIINQILELNATKLKAATVSENSQAVYYAEIKDDVTHIYAFEPAYTAEKAAPETAVTQSVPEDTLQDTVPSRLLSSKTDIWVDPVSIIPEELRPYVTVHKPDPEGRPKCYSIALRYLVSVVELKFTDARLIWYVAEGMDDKRPVIYSDVEIVKSLRDVDPTLFSDPDGQTVCYVPDSFKTQEDMEKTVRSDLLSSMRSYTLDALRKSNVGKAMKKLSTEDLRI